MPGYVELRSMSWYSFMEGASSTDEMVGHAQELGYDALALTDRDNLAGALDFAAAAQECGIKPIIGVTLMLASDEEGEASPITLLAETQRGYANICNLITFAHIAAEERTEPVLYSRYLPDRTEGIIVLVGAPESRIASLTAAGSLGEAELDLLQLTEWFSAENVFVELQRHFVYGDMDRNRALSALAGRVGVETVATGGVCYHVRERSRLHDAVTAIRHNLTLDASHRERKANSHYYFKPPERMEALFSEWPDAVANTRRIADRCMAFNVDQLKYRFPQETVPDGFENQQSYLEHLCFEAAKRRYGSITEKVGARLEEEFTLIEKHDLAGFLLLYHRIIRLAQEVAVELGHSSPEIPIEERPPGRGRGSSVAMLVGTLIGLSHIDPLEYDLPLERFLPDDALATVPDIDLDFPRDIREALILRVFEEFGWDRAALTAMIPTYRLRGVVRDLGKALGLPVLELDFLAKRADSNDARNLAREMESMEEFRGKLNHPGWRELIDLGAQLQGFPKGLAQHPGGMIISSSPLIDMTPVQRSAIDGRYICQFDKNAADEAGFLKIDFLALGALSQMQECLKLIEARTGTHIDLSRIDFEDGEVYDDMARGDTVGVFQIESAAQMQTIPRLKPQNLYDLALEVAAVRPGVGANDGVSEFIRRRNGDPWDYDHPLEKRALEKSLGIILFQDQVVVLGMDVGGFTASDADQMRRAFQRKNNEALVQRYWDRFQEGALARGVPLEKAQKIFHKFNPHYMFPEAHALAFGVTSYHMAWLRHYYPTEFYTSIFNAQPMGFWSLETLKEDAARLGVKVLGPDVNISETRCVPEGETSFRLGLRFVHGLNETSAETLIENRRWYGPYDSLADLTSRSRLNRNALGSLVKAGACDGLPDFTDRRRALWEVGLRYEAAGPQGRLDLDVSNDMADLLPVESEDRMAFEYETLGMWTEGHVMGVLRSSLEREILSSAQLSDCVDGDIVLTAGKVLRRQRPLGKMVFMTLEDEHGMIPLAVAPEAWERLRSVLSQPLIVASGEVSRRDDTLNIMVQQAWPLHPPWSARTKVPNSTRDFR